MAWRTLARWGVRRTWKYNRHYADSATLAHAIHKRRLRQRAARIMSSMGLRVIPTVTPLALEIVNQFNNSNTGTGQRAWPEVSGAPPVFGNYIGEFGHTAGGTYVWTGFSWEPAIYPG